MTRRKPFQNRESQNRERAHRDARAGPKQAGPKQAGLKGAWLYGSHTVRAALANPDRILHRLLVTADADKSLGPQRIPAEITDRQQIDSQLPADAVHQGLALLADPLPEIGVEDIVFQAGPKAVVLVLDQVTDPQNVGAVLRAAAAFGAIGVIVHDRHAPPITGALAKAASGALETVPLVRAVNIVRALDMLKEASFWCAGLAEDAATPLDRAEFAPRTALVLGAEGEGLRRLTRETCDLLIRIPTTAALGSLNVATATAVALYEVVRGR